MIHLVKILLGFYVLLGVLAPFIANDRPLWVAYQDGSTSWPLFQKEVSSEKKLHRVVRAPIPFSADQITSLKNRYLPPFSRVQLDDRSVRHWLGTDRLGRDLAAIMVHGCRKSLYIAVLAMGLALIIGTFLGGLAGYLGNSSRLPWYVIVVLLSLLTYSGYLVFALQSYWLALTAFSLAMAIAVTAGIRGNQTGWQIWLDAFVMRAIEVFNSVPLLLLLIAASSIMIRPSLTGLGILIGVMSWTRFARFSRAEVIRIKEQEYVTAAQISGENSRAILSSYILPEAAPALMVVFIFGISSAILLESTLSFLGIGLPIDEMTWGSVLSQARGNIRAWWLALFPGLGIFFLITCLNFLADHVQDRLRRG